MQIGFVGAGQMASALARGLVNAGMLRVTDIVAHDPSAAAREAFVHELAEATLVETNIDVVAQSDVVLLAVKPQHIPSVAQELRGHVKDKLVISIAAGIALSALGQQLGTKRIIRVMPNAPCLVGTGAAGIALGSDATDQDAQFVKQMMGAVGIAHVVSEQNLDVVTGLSGSGPAFAAIFIEALTDGAVRMGLAREVASELAAQTVAGAAQMVLQAGRHPAILKDQVASPGGTTIAGIQVLEDRSFRGAVMAAVVAATQCARELGN